MTHLSVLIAGLALLLSACGGQTGDIAPPACSEAFERVTPTTQTALGFSGAELLASVAVPQEVELTWLDGRHSTGTLQLALDSQLLDEGMVHVILPRASDDPSCTARIEVPVTGQLVTIDGLLAETLGGYLRAGELGSSSYQERTYAADVVGSIDLAAFAADDWSTDSATVMFEIDLHASGSTGVFELMTHREAQQGDGYQEVVATW